MPGYAVTGQGFLVAGGKLEGKVSSGKVCGGKSGGREIRRKG